MPYTAWPTLQRTISRGMLTLELRTARFALASVAQVEHHSIKPKGAGSIPSQGAHLGCGLGPWLGTHKRQPIDSFPPFPSSKMDGISLSEDLKKKKKGLILAIIGPITTS